MIRRILVCTLVLLSIAGCASGKGSATPQPQQPAAGAPGPGLGLPAPSVALAKARHSSALIVNEGSGYVASLPNSHITVDGSTGIYSPNWDPGSSIGDAAFALYDFNLDGEASRQLRLTDGGTGVDYKDVWVGLADFANDRWDWQQTGEFDPYNFDIGTHINASSDVIFALVITGHQKFKLNSATFVSSDEVEDNDAQGAGLSMNSWNFRGQTGNLGSSPLHAGTDGDKVDWWVLNGPFPTGSPSNTEIVVQARPYYNENSPQIELTLYNSSGVEVGNSSFSFSNISPGDDGFTSAADLPLYVKIEMLPGLPDQYSEYELECTLDAPPTASLTPASSTGPLPLPVNFDASGSAATDPNDPISYYEWFFTYDPADANPKPDFVTASPTTSFNFATLGFYKAYVNVVTESGASDNRFAYITAGDIPYDEREYNSFYTSANILPSASGSGWRGNIGFDPVTAPPFHGWDGGFSGDDEDAMGYELQPGEAILYTVTKLNGPGDLTMEIHGSEDGGFDQSKPHFDDMLERQYYRDPAFYSSSYTPCLDLQAADGVYGDYTVAWLIGKPPLDQTVTPDVSSGAAPLTVNFTPGATDDDGTIDHYIWDFDDDGTSDATSNGPIQHVFSTAGNPRVKVYPVDNDGFTTYFPAFVDINAT